MQLKKIFNKAVVTMGAGVAIGLTGAAIAKRYDGIVPLIGPYLPLPWGNYSTLGLIIIGGVTLGLAKTKLIKGADIKNVATGFGLTTLLSGVLNGIFPIIGLPARARAPLRLNARPIPSQAARAAARMSPVNVTGVPPARILA